jgi:hypothetical protein
MAYPHLFRVFSKYAWRTTPACYAQPAGIFCRWWPGVAQSD